jgi:hypothetical protein
MLPTSLVLTSDSIRWRRWQHRAHPFANSAKGWGTHSYDSSDKIKGRATRPQYQADPMSSSGKDILQQLSQMSSSAQAFIIVGYGGSVLGGVGDAVAADLAAGPQHSVLFGRFHPEAGGGFPGYLNTGSPFADWLRIGFGWDGSQTGFRISVGDSIHLLGLPWPW